MPRKTTTTRTTECVYSGCRATSALGLLHNGDGVTTLFPMPAGGLCYTHAEYGQRTSNGERARDVAEELGVRYA